MDDQKVVGIFSSQQNAINAIERLKRDGYKDDEISVLAKDHENVDKVSEATNIDVQTSDAKEGAAGGALAGGILGGIGALLIELGVIAIPGVGPFLAAGPVAAALTGALAGGAVGGIVGALVDMGLSKEEAEEYEGYLDRGDILVMVDKHDERNAYGNFYENESVIRDRYDRRYFEHHEDTDLNKFRDPTQGNRIIEPDNPGRPVDPENPNEPIDPIDPDGSHRGIDKRR